MSSSWQQMSYSCIAQHGFATHISGCISATKPGLLWRQDTSLWSQLSWHVWDHQGMFYWRPQQMRTVCLVMGMTQLKKLSVRLTMMRFLFCNVCKELLVCVCRDTSQPRCLYCTGTGFFEANSWWFLSSIFTRPPWANVSRIMFFMALVRRTPPSANVSRIMSFVALLRRRPQSANAFQIMCFVDPNCRCVWSVSKHLHTPLRRWWQNAFTA